MNGQVSSSTPSHSVYGPSTIRPPSHVSIVNRLPVLHGPLNLSTASTNGVSHGSMINPSRSASSTSSASPIPNAQILARYSSATYSSGTTATSTGVAAALKNTVAPVPYIRVIPTANLQNISANAQQNLLNTGVLTGPYFAANGTGPYVVPPIKVQRLNNGTATPAAVPSSSTAPAAPRSRLRKTKRAPSWPSTTQPYPSHLHSQVPDPTTSMFTVQVNSTTSSTVGLQVKDGVAVDPQCQTQNATVYFDPNCTYSVTLARCDWETGTNDFHKLQILQSSVPRFAPLSTDRSGDSSFTDS